MVLLCETAEALERVQDTYRAMLRAASKRRPDIYAVIGKAFAMRREVLSGAVPPARQVKQANGSAEEVAMAHA